MARLMPNPLGDIKEPLERVEQAVGTLAAELRDVRSLPTIHAELVKLNGTMAAVLDELQGLRQDLGDAPSRRNAKGSR